MMVEQLGPAAPGLSVNPLSEMKRRMPASDGRLEKADCKHQKDCVLHRPEFSAILPPSGYTGRLAQR